MKMNRLPLAFLALLGLCACFTIRASAQSAAPAPAVKLLHCDLKNDPKTLLPTLAEHCVLAPGHTLEEAVSAELRERYAVDANLAVIRAELVAAEAANKAATARLAECDVASAANQATVQKMGEMESTIEMQRRDIATLKEVAAAQKR